MGCGCLGLCGGGAGGVGCGGVARAAGCARAPAAGGGVGWRPDADRCVSRRGGQAFIENAIRGNPITINGDGYDRLDFTYIGDLVQGLVLCLARPEARNQVFNLTYGQGRSLREMVDILQQHFPDVAVEHHPRDGLMPERGTLDVTKARDLLGYRPANPLEEGFSRYIEWYKGLAAEKPHLFK